MSAEPRIDLSRHTDAVRSAPLFRVEGHVRQAVGQLLEIEGLDAPVGSELEVVSGRRGLRLEVLGFRADVLVAAPLDVTAGISPGARVRLAMRSAGIPVGDALLGRVLDAFGRPLDGM